MISGCCVLGRYLGSITWLQADKKVDRSPIKKRDIQSLSKFTPR